MSGNSESAKTFPESGLADIRGTCTLLTCICLAVVPLLAGVGYAHDGWTGILAALLAVGVCWGGAVASLAIVGMFRTGPEVVHGVLLGMLLRMGAPLAACIVLGRRGGPLVEAGVLVMIVLCYFVTLIAETCLLLRWNQKQHGGKTVSRVS